VSEVAPPPSRLPVEGDEIGASWLGRCAATLVAVLARPVSSFRHVPEPVEHARALRFLATLRLPAWGVLVAILGVRLLTSEGPGLVDTHPLHAFVEPALLRAWSTFLILLIPVGLPLLYFFAGLVAHIGIALTGGAPRSIGISMRAVGFSMGPWLLVVGLLDIPLYLDALPGLVHPIVTVVFAVQFLLTAGLVLARSHQISVVRGLLVALLPTLLLLTVTALRVAPELSSLPGAPPPASPYFVP
jgi:hypothetical protein